MRADFCLASPPDRMAASIDPTRARLAASQLGNLLFRLANARLLLTLVVDCESMVSISTSRASSPRGGLGTP